MWGQGHEVSVPNAAVGSVAQLQVQPVQGSLAAINDDVRRCIWRNIWGTNISWFTTTCGLIIGEEGSWSHLWAKKIYFICFLGIIANATEVLFPPVCVCLLVCQQENIKTAKQNSIRLGRRTSLSPEQSPLTFGLDPDKGVHTYFYLYDTEITSVLLFSLHSDVSSGVARSHLNVCTCL